MVNHLCLRYRNIITIFTIAIISSSFTNSGSIVNDVYSQTGEKLTITLNQAQFIPLEDSSRQLEVAVDYTLNDLSLYGSTINGVMETFAADGTQLKTSSYPDGFTITESGIIVFSTSLDDPQIQTATANITLTDLEKTETISNTLSTTIPFNDEEGQERLINKIASSDQEIENALNEINNQDSSAEVERITSSSQSGLNITSANSFFEGDFFYIVGEVLNNANDDREFAKVTATLYDGNQDVIGTDYTFTEPSTIPSRESSPFKIAIDSTDVDSLEDISSYKVVASAND